MSFVFFAVVFAATETLVERFMKHRHSKHRFVARSRDTNRQFRTRSFFLKQRIDSLQEK